MIACPQGACAGMDANIFVPVPMRDNKDKPRYDKAVAKAKAVCATCTVTDQCLNYALTLIISQGVFGGLDQKERKAEARRRGLKSRAYTSNGKQRSDAKTA